MAQLTNATAPIGAQVDFVTIRPQFRMVSTVAGNASSLLLNLEGSVDGTVWTVLASSTSVTGETVLCIGRGEARFIRPNLVSIVTAPGGPAPSVSAFVSSL